MANHEPIRKGSSGPASGGGPTSRRPTPRQDIPDKLYFRIGEVAKLCGVPAYVLRFWEAEFPQLRPNKGGTGQRLFRRRDVEMALRVKTLLYDEGYTIPGARQALKLELRQPKEPQLALGVDADTTPGSSVDASHLQAIHKELSEIHALLSRPATLKSSVQSIRRTRSTPEARPDAPKPVTPRPAPRMFPSPTPVVRFDSLFDLFDEPPAEKSAPEPGDPSSDL
jgi:DNA-binding transcriptional MerR regulator